MNKDWAYPLAVIALAFALAVGRAATDAWEKRVFRRRCLMAVGKMQRSRACRWLLWRRHRWSYRYERRPYGEDVFSRQCADCPRAEVQLRGVWYPTALGDEFR